MNLNQSLYLGERTRLTRIELESDPAALAAWTKDAALLRSLGEEVARPLSVWDVKKRLEKVEKEMDEGDTLYYFHIRPREGDTLLGWGKIYWILWASQIGNLELAIAPSEQGKGYGSDAMGLLLRIAFRELNLHRVAVSLPSYNLPGIALAQKFGFRQEACRREVYLRDGKRWDDLSFGLLNAEWSANHE
jgi:RimJ/RimL family protein N-acetyltransferase